MHDLGITWGVMGGSIQIVCPCVEIVTKVCGRCPIYRPLFKGRGVGDPDGVWVNFLHTMYRAGGNIQNPLNHALMYRGRGLLMKVTWDPACRCPLVPPTSCTKGVGERGLILNLHMHDLGITWGVMGGSIQIWWKIRALYAPGVGGDTHPLHTHARLQCGVPMYEIIIL